MQSGGIYFDTPLPLNLANKQASNKQQEACHHSVLAITPVQRLGLSSTLAILEPRWWLRQIQAKNSLVTTRGAQSEGALPNLYNFGPKTAIFFVCGKQPWNPFKIPKGREMVAHSMCRLTSPC